MSSSGLELKRGDEVLTTDQDYPRMMTTWKQRERRDGIVLKTISFPTPPPSLEDLADRFERAITPRTRVIHFCHITNLTGQIFPVKRICQMARSRGIEAIVEAHMPTPSFPSSMPTWIAITTASACTSGCCAAWHRLPLRAQIEDRESVAVDGRAAGDDGKHPQIRGNRDSSGGQPQRHLGRAGVSLGDRRRAQGGPSALPARAVDRAADAFAGSWDADQYRSAPKLRHRAADGGGQGTGSMSEQLWDKYHIITVGIVHPQFKGLRITPNVYTTAQEIDIFCDAIEKLIA